MQYGIKADCAVLIRRVGPNEAAGSRTRELPRVGIRAAFADNSAGTVNRYSGRKS
jgi:hypothetical protein